MAKTKATNRRNRVVRGKLYKVMHNGVEHAFKTYSTAQYFCELNHIKTEL